MLTGSDSLRKWSRRMVARPTTAELKLAKCLILSRTSSFWFCLIWFFVAVTFVASHQESGAARGEGAFFSSLTIVGNRLDCGGFFYYVIGMKFCARGRECLPHRNNRQVVLFYENEQVIT
ncbi:MAG: hypothetical protein HQM00_07090 [Magnetococcales bacterium]|nr:hypothetical protein [Magnetococcales bacterium]